MCYNSLCVFTYNGLPPIHYVQLARELVSLFFFSVYRYMMNFGDFRFLTNRVPVNSLKVVQCYKNA